MKQGVQKRPKLSPSHSFISGGAHKERIGHYVDCSDDPYDMRPAVEAVLKATREASATLPPGQPLVILIGEQHAMPAFVELQHAVAVALLAEGADFMVCFEQPHNRWARLARGAWNKNVDDALYYNVNDYDPHGRATLSSYMGYAGVMGADAAHHNFLAFCYESNVTSAFTDVSHDVNGVDLKDPFTIAAARRHLPAEEIEYLSEKRLIPKLMATRNDLMAWRGARKAAAQGKDIIQHSAGGSHVFGSVQDKCAYEESLCAAYEREGAYVLPVFLTSRKEKFGLNVLPKEAYEKLEQSVVIDGLAQERLIYPKVNAEKQFIREKLYAHSGLELQLRNVHGRRDEYTDIAKAEAEHVFSQFEAS